MKKPRQSLGKAHFKSVVIERRTIEGVKEKQSKY